MRRSIRSLEAAEIHRRVIAAGGPALIFRNVKGADFPLVTNLFGTARRAELAFGERPLRLIRRLVQLVETLLPPTPAKDVGRARCRPRAAEDRRQAHQRRADHRGRHRRRAPRSAAGDDHLARRRRSIHDAATGLHAASGRTRLQPGHVSASRARRSDDRHALADWQGRRLPLPGRRGAQSGAAGHGVSRRPAGAHSGCHRAAARKCAGTDARLAHRW